MAKTPEDKVKDKIIAYLKELEKLNYPIYHERRQAWGSSKGGLADIMLVVQGIHIELECKAPGGELRAEQEKWKAKCDRIGIIYIEADDLQVVKNFLEINFGYLI